VLGSFIVYVGFVEMTRYIPSPAARPELGPALRQIVMLRFRPSGLIPERLGTDGTERRRSWRHFFSRSTERGAPVGAIDEIVAVEEIDVRAEPLKEAGA
jgi:hypothetical protein